MMSCFRIYGFLFSFFWRQTTVPPLKRFVSYFCLLLFLALSTLFYQYIDLYRGYFLEKLRGVYPETFVQTRGRMLAAPDGFRHYQEVFEFSKSFRFRFTPSADQKILADVGIRTSDRLPSGAFLQDGDDALWRSGRLMFVSENLCDRLSESESFDGKSIIIEDSDGKIRQVAIRPFELFGEKNWLYLPSELGWSAGFVPNIVRIEGDEKLTPRQVRDIYEREGVPVFFWNDRLPFFTSVFHYLLNSYFSGIIAGALILFLVMNFSYIKDTLREFKKIIMFSSLYGLNVNTVILTFILFLSFWLSVLYCAAFGLKLWINARVAYLVPVIGERLYPSFYTGMLVLLITGLVVMSLAYIRFFYSRQTRILGG